MESLACGLPYGGVVGEAVNLGMSLGQDGENRPCFGCTWAELPYTLYRCGRDVRVVRLPEHLEKSREGLDRPYVPQGVRGHRDVKGVGVDTHPRQ